jgi:hypothetical protein
MESPSGRPRRPAVTAARPQRQGCHDRRAHPVGFPLGHAGCRTATTMSYYCGRNPAPLIGKMKKLLRHPGGHNRLGSSDNMTARAGGRGSVGLPNPDDPLTFRHSGGMSEGLPLLRGTPGRTHGPGNPRWSGRHGSLDCHLRPRGTRDRERNAPADDDAIAVKDSGFDKGSQEFAPAISR